MSILDPDFELQAQRNGADVVFAQFKYSVPSMMVYEQLDENERTIYRKVRAVYHKYEGDAHKYDMLHTLDIWMMNWQENRYAIFNRQLDSLMTPVCSISTKQAREMFMNSCIPPTSSGDHILYKMEVDVGTWNSNNRDKFNILLIDAGTYIRSMKDEENPRMFYIIPDFGEES